MVVQKRLLRPEEVAAILSVSKWTIYRWVDEGRLRATKVGPGCLRIFMDSVEALVEDNIIEKEGQGNKPCRNRSSDLLNNL